MKACVAYIRVSTAKQGLHSVSLPEQRDAIAAFAKRENLTITQWFEERVTAAKRGRPIFGAMLAMLSEGRASGVILHKIDRGARNLKDWADLGELIDRGIDVHFVTDNLDMRSRGGRLSADITAVVSADYIRNLREETKKGFYGRLKQGFYPMRAPLGYLDCGKAKPKTLDPVRAPLIRYAFEEYASGRHTLKTIRADLTVRGLRNRQGRPVSQNGISSILNNPFYFGEMRIHRTQERFPGNHDPLISRALFHRVQAALQGKTQRRATKHSFTFSRLITCATCGYSLTGERQKGHVYYRCHTSTCPSTSLREEHVDEQMRTAIYAAQITEDAKLLLIAEAHVQRQYWHELDARRREQMIMQMEKLRDRLTRLTDAYLDNVIDKDTFEERRIALTAEQAELQKQATQTAADPSVVFDQFADFLELSSSLCSSYGTAFGPDKRDVIRKVTSNRVAQGKNLAITLQKPFQLIAETQNLSDGDPYRCIPRTFEEVWDALSNPIKSGRLFGGGSDNR